MAEAPKGKVMTLVSLYNDTDVLLAMKKRGFGVGRWNGYGGKVQAGESIQEAALRELKEESGITTDITAAGKITFHFKGEALDVFYFRNSQFTGEAIETEEMTPKWFPKNALPFNEMWPSDVIWMPRFFAGETLSGEFWLRDDGSVEKHEL
jgi:8-oxo-dGTP diphosphatase/2-hydroxy-dATP diphosphatase